MRALCLTLLVSCIGLTLTGCGHDAKQGGAPGETDATDAVVAAQIKKSQKQRQRQSREIDVEQEVARANAANAPTAGQAEPVLPAASGEEQPSSTPAPASEPTNRSLLSAADRSSFAALEARLGGSSGVAVKPAGSGGDVAAAGTLRSGAAWSTMKAAVAAATYSSGAPSASTVALLTRAITASDNAAAEQLWSELGPPAEAGRRVTAELRAAGDTDTVVQTKRLRAGYTAFGQSQWALTDQARFMSGLPCTGPGKRVLNLMGQVVADQRWGLGSAGVPAAFKGGWGPGTGGGYLVRQMGILTIHGTPLAVTIATLPADGAFGTGTDHLTQIARWVAGHVNTRGMSRGIAC